MATPKIIADFESQLATAIAIGGTSFTLSSATDDDNIALPTGLYYFTVDNGSAAKEYLAGTLTGVNMTGVVSVSRQGVETSGAVRAHRVGASVILTDFATYMVYMNAIALAGAADASAAAKGVVQTPTTAQVNTGTATGSTGAKLAVTPDALAASIYGLQLPSSTQKDALAGTETPSVTNKFVTLNKSLTAGATINGLTLPVPVYQDSSTFKYLACQASDTSKMKFQGFATSNSTDTNPINIQFSGVVAGFTGLTRGVPYYVQDPVGTIGTTAGTNEVLVGIAISTTEILIQKGRRIASGVTSFASTTTATITTGFKPSRVIIHANTSTANNGGMSVGGWTKQGGNGCSYQIIDSGSTSEVAATSAEAWHASLFDGGPTDHVGIIDTITDTTFRLNNTKTGSPGTVYLFWTAEGDI